MLRRIDDSFSLKGLSRKSVVSLTENIVTDYMIETKNNDAFLRTAAQTLLLSCFSYVKVNSSFGNQNIKSIRKLLELPASEISRLMEIEDVESVYKYLDSRTLNHVRDIAYASLNFSYRKKYEVRKELYIFDRFKIEHFILLFMTILSVYLVINLLSVGTSGNVHSFVLIKVLNLLSYVVALSFLIHEAFNS